MEIKEAVALAKQYILDLFAEENISYLGLEEVEFDELENIWIITLGFSRPWDEPTNILPTLLAKQNSPLRRTYKIVRIPNDTKKMMSVKNREAQS